MYLPLDLNCLLNWHIFYYNITIEWRMIMKCFSLLGWALTFTIIKKHFLINTQLYWTTIMHRCHAYLADMDISYSLMMWASFQMTMSYEDKSKSYYDNVYNVYGRIMMSQYQSSWHCNTIRLPQMSLIHEPLSRYQRNTFQCFLESLKRSFLKYYMHCDRCSRFKY